MNSSLPSLHQKQSSQCSLKTLLDYKKCKMSNQPSPSNSTQTNFHRDISHLSDTARQQQIQKQLKEKKQQADELFSEYLQSQRERKKTQELMSSLHIKPPKNNEDTFDDVLSLLERYSDINLNVITNELQDYSKDRKGTLTQLQTTIHNAIEKGFFEPNKSVFDIKRSKQKKLVEEMKQVNSHCFSTEPAGRQDAIILRKWLSNHLLEIQTAQGVDHKQKLESAQDALFSSLNELIRQVSFNCVERGQLMMAIVKGYIILFRKTISMNESDKQSQKLMNYKTELETQLLFEKELEYKDTQILNCKQQIKELNDRLSVWQEENGQLSGQIKNLQKIIDVDRSIKKTAASLIGNLNREIRELRNKIQKIHVKSFEPHFVEEEIEEADLSLGEVLKEVDQKTYVEVNPDIVVKDVVDEPPVITFSVGVQYDIQLTQEIGCQCSLLLVEPQFDKIMQQQELETCLKEFELKEQVGFKCIFTNQTFGIDDKEPQKETVINQRQSLLRLLDGLPGNMDEVKKMNKSDMLDLFLNNVKQLRGILDREEQYSDTEQSVLEQDEERRSFNQIRDSRDSKIDFRSQIDEMPETLEQSPKKPQKSLKKPDPPATISVAAKYGLTKQEQLQLKTQVSMLIMLYNIQQQKTQNLTKSMNDLAGLLNENFNFTRKLMIHLLKTQKQSHRQIVEQFMFEFEAMRKQLPVEMDKEILETDYLFTEVDEEEDKERKRQQIFKKKRNRITKALVFNFQQKPSRTSAIDKLMHPGVVLALKAKEQSYLFKKVVNYWPVKNVLKTVTQIYDEKIRSQKDTGAAKDMDMQIFVFNNFLNRYGFKTVAEKKYLQFLLSVIHFSSIFRINVFARIICILKDEKINFSNEESTFFIQGLEFMNSESTLGVNIIQSESDHKFHVPYLRALDYMKVYLENKLSEEELRDLRQDLENLKEADPKNVNKAGIIDVDIFLIKVLGKYRSIIVRTKMFVIHAFQAADLDGNKKINHNEFLTLMRHIESEKFNFKEAMDLFDEQADIMDGEERNLSFNRYTSMCVNQQIFSEKSLNKFIGIENDGDLEKGYQSVVNEWETYKEDILQTLKHLQPYVTKEIFEEWNNILKTLEVRLKSENPTIKPILIAHKILRLELERLLKVGQQEDDNNEEID